MSKKNSGSDPIGILQELESIRRLLIFALLRSGASQAEIAVALGVNQSSISRMFPGGLAKPAKASK